MAGTQQQIDNLAKARAAKAAKTQGNKDKEISGISFMTDDQVWLRGLLKGIELLDVRSAVYVKTAVPIADEVLSQYKAKFDA